MTSLRHNGSDDRERTTRDDYLDAARDCILDVGWRRTTLTEVARRAEVSRMTIYRTWPDMPTLLGDLMTREWGTVVADTVALEPATGDAAHRLAHALAATACALRQNELFVRIVELDPELLLPYLLARRGRSQEAVIGLVAERIRAGQADREIREGDPVTLARTLVLAAHGSVVSAHTMVDDDAAQEDLDAELVGLIERGLRP